MWSATLVRYSVTAVAMKAVTSFGSVLRVRNFAIHSRRTVSALAHALLLATRRLRSAFCSSFIGPDWLVGCW